MKLFKPLMTLTMSVGIMLLSSFTQNNTSLTQSSWTPPQEVSLKDSTDFDDTEDDILECKKWMESNPYKKGDAKWTRANRLILQWVMGSPKFHMTLYDFQSIYTKEFLIAFMGGCAAHAIKSNFKSSDADNYVAGFELVMKVYNNAIKKKKNKKLLKLMEIKKEGKLKEWVENQIKNAKG